MQENTRVPAVFEQVGVAVLLICVNEVGNNIYTYAVLGTVNTLFIKSPVIGLLCLNKVILYVVN